MRRLLLALVLILAVCRPSQAAFTLVSGQHAYTSSQTVSVLVLTLPNNPTPGNLVCLGFGWYNGVLASSTIVSILDANGNAYTLSANSPSSTNGTTAGAVYLAYLLSAPVGASKTVTVSWTTPSTSTSGFIDEFHSSVGGVTFDAALTGSGSVTPIATPSIPVSGSGELVYAYASPQDLISAAGGSWVLPETLPRTFGDAAAYILSVSANTALNFTHSGGNLWDSMGMSFKETGGAPTCAPTLTLLGVGRCN
jgi:hypothetical protein